MMEMVTGKMMWIVFYGRGFREGFDLFTISKNMKNDAFIIKSNTDEILELNAAFSFLEKAD